MLLHRLRVDVHLGECRELAVEGSKPGRPARLPDAQIFIGANTALAVGYAQGRKFRLVPPDADACNKPPGGHAVDRGEPLGGGDWIAVGHDQNRHAQPDAIRVSGDRGERDERVVAVSPVGGARRGVDDDVVIDEDRVIAEFLGLFRCRDDRFGRRLEAEIVGVGAAARKSDLRRLPPGLARTALAAVVPASYRGCAFAASTRLRAVVIFKKIYRD